MRILPLLLIITLAMSAAGSDISEILGKKLEVKKEQTKQEKIWEDAFIDKLGSFIEKLEDKSTINFIRQKDSGITQYRAVNKTLEIDIQNHPIQKIKLKGITGRNGTVQTDILQIPQSQQSYAIDPTQLRFFEGEIEVTAKGEKLYKCPTWNYTTGICEPICKPDDTGEIECDEEWTYQQDITPGQTYTVRFNSTDPAYFETSATPDLAFAPINNETFVAAFIDLTQSDASFRIINTNGTIKVNTTDVDTSVGTTARIASTNINTSDFVISWTNGTGSIFVQHWRYNGTSVTNTTSRISLGSSIGVNNDIKAIQFGDRYAICYANDGLNDADFQIRNNTNGASIVGETATDPTIGIALPGQNLIDCAPVNGNSRFLVFWFDDASNDATYAIANTTGSIPVGQADIDTDIGETGQVAAAGLNGVAALVWYDSTDQDITIAGKNSAGTTTFGPTDIDTAAGTDSRVAAGTMALTNGTKLLLVAWQDQTTSDIKAGVYTETGAQFTAPFTVTTGINTTYPLLDIFAQESATGQGICPGKFIVGYSNASGQGEFKGYFSNGTLWDGICVRTASVSNVKPINDILITPNTASIRISAEVVGGTITNVTANIKLPNSSTTTINLQPCVGGGCAANEYNATYYLPGLDGYYNITITANNTDGLPGSANTIIMVLNPPRTVTVIRGLVTGTNGVLNATLPQSVNTTNSFVMIDTMTYASNPQQWQWTPNLTNSTYLQFTRYGTGTGANITYQLATGKGIQTQSGTANLALGQSSVNITINQVNLAHTFALVYGRCNSTSNSDSQSGFFLANIVNSTLLRLERGNAGNCAAIASWQVVQWDRVRVIGGNVTKPGGVDGINVTLNTQINTSRSFLTFGISAVGIDAGLDTNAIQGNITSNNTLLFQNKPGQTSLNSQRDIHYYIIEMPYGYVQSGTEDLVKDLNVTIQPVNATRALLFASGWDYGTGTMYLNIQRIINLTNSTTLQFTKLTAAQTQNIIWEVFELYSECPGPITKDYNLTKDINTTIQIVDQCLNVQGDNITINCNGFRIFGDGTGTGLFLQNRKNITVKNCFIADFDTNFKITNTTNSLFINNTMLNATNYAFASYDSSNNQHINSTYINGKGNGTLLQNSTNNTFTNLIIESSTENAATFHSSDNRLTDSIIRTNTGTGINFISGNNNITNTIIESNTTWIQTAAGGNILINITFNSTNGSIRTLTQVTIPSDIIVNTQKLNTSFNLSFVNDTNLSFLNISSQITLRGLNFTNVTPIFDQTDSGIFTICMTPQCTFQSYNGSTFIFNVTGFSRYAAKERDDAPIILPDTNLTGSVHLLNGTVRIRANIISQLTVTNANVTITHPNGTQVKLSLVHLGNTTWETNYTNLTQRGRYNLTFYAKDNLNNIGNETSHFRRISFNLVDFVAPNGDGEPTLSNFSFLNYTIQITSNISGILNFTMNLGNTTIRQINFTNHPQDSPKGTIEYQDYHSPKEENMSFKLYAINPEGMEFTTATFSVNASGEKLYKCASYDFTNRDCLGTWEFLGNITKGQIYAVTINATDPAFLETSGASDESISPLDGDRFLIGFTDIADLDVSFRIMYTNGSIIVNTTDVDTTVTADARVDVSWFNGTHFVIYWADTTDGDATFQIFSFNGTNVTSVAGPTDAGTGIGAPNVDVSVAVTGDRFATCYANDNDNDADYQIWNYAGTNTVGETALEDDMRPSMPLQNLISCTGMNSTVWAYNWYDNSGAGPNKRSSYATVNTSGTTLTGPTDVITSIGFMAETTSTTIDNDKLAIVVFDWSNSDVLYTIRYINGTIAVAPTIIDSNAGSTSRVAATSVRENRTEQFGLLATAWWDSGDATIKAMVIRSNGTNFTAPFNVTTTPNATYPLLEIKGRNPITNQEICPGRFIVAFSNNSGQGQYLGFFVNGTSWNGICETDLIATNLTVSNFNPDEHENVTFNASLFNTGLQFINGSVTARNFVVSLVDGNCTNGTQKDNVTIVNLTAGFNITVPLSWNATPVGPHNISFCVNYYNTTLEYNYSNNNITVTINVKAYNYYFGNLSGNVTLDTNLNRTEYDWIFNDSGNVMFTDSDLTINFNSLYALGRNISGGIATNDFLEADQALNMTGFNDSIQIFWATNASNPKQTINLTVRGRYIENVPYINSTNTSNFITGILWQSQNSTNREFNATQKQPLIFVSMINRNQTGFYGNYDYESRVPVLLRSYNSSSSSLQYFVELK